MIKEEIKSELVCTLGKFELLGAAANTASLSPTFLAVFGVAMHFWTVFGAATFVQCRLFMFLRLVF